MAGSRLTVRITSPDHPVKPTRRQARPVRRGARLLEEYERAATELDRFIAMQAYIRSLAVALGRRDPDAADRLLRAAHQDLHRVGRTMAAELGRPRPGEHR